VFYEGGVARKNFTHAGGKEKSFDRQPLAYLSGQCRKNSLTASNLLMWASNPAAEETQSGRRSLLRACLASPHNRRHPEASICLNSIFATQPSKHTSKYLLTNISFL
jgi:hypothetical protein